MSKAKLGDYLFKGAVTALVGVSVLGGVSVAISMAERFTFHRQHNKAALEGQEGQEGQQQ